MGLAMYVSIHIYTYEKVSLYGASEHNIYVYASSYVCVYGFSLWLHSNLAIETKTGPGKCAPCTPLIPLYYIMLHCKNVSSRQASEHKIYVYASLRMLKFLNGFH